MKRSGKQIVSLVDQFNASPEVRAAAKQNAERTAVKLKDELGPTKAAIASVANEFLRLGRDLAEISVSISRLHSSIGRLNDLVVEVFPVSGDIRVTVDGRDRPFQTALPDLGGAVR